MKFKHWSNRMPCITVTNEQGSPVVFLKWMDGRWFVQMVSRSENATGVMTSVLINAALQDKIPGRVIIHSLDAAHEGAIRPYPFGGGSPRATQSMRRRPGDKAGVWPLRGTPLEEVAPEQVVRRPLRALIEVSNTYPAMIEDLEIGRRQQNRVMCS